MNILEAKDQLENLKEDRKNFLENDAEHDEMFLKDIEAIDTVLQALEELQKENEKLKDRNKILENCKYVNILEIEKSKAEEKERWRNKIKEKIELIKTLRVAFYNEANVISILEELLKGE